MKIKFLSECQCLLFRLFVSTSLLLNQNVGQELVACMYRWEARGSVELWKSMFESFERYLRLVRNSLAPATTSFPLMLCSHCSDGKWYLLSILGQIEG